MSRNHAAHFVLSSALTSSQRQQNGAQGENGKGHGVGEGREREDYCLCLLLYGYCLPNFMDVALMASFVKSVS